MGLFTKPDASFKGIDRKRILITDDEAPIRALFRMILATSLPDVTIDEACNGLEAVRLFEESHHGVILMDLRMPEMDGLSAFLAIQNMCIQEGRQMPHVVFCTGFAPQEAVREIVAGGGYHSLIQKPVRSADIADVVRARLQAE